jgi:hypothetical protein
MNNAMTTRRARKSNKFAPAAWQWDPSQLADLPDCRIQVWTANGGMAGLVSADVARDMVASGEYFLGSSIHVCQVTDRTDAVNRVQS